MSEQIKVVCVLPLSRVMKPFQKKLSNLVRNLLALGKMYLSSTRTMIYTGCKKNNSKNCVLILRIKKFEDSPIV